MEESTKMKYLDQLIQKPEEELSPAERIMLSKFKDLSQRKSKLHEHMKKLEVEIKKANQDFFALSVALQVLAETMAESEEFKDLNTEG